MCCVCLWCTGLPTVVEILEFLAANCAHKFELTEALLVDAYEAEVCLCICTVPTVLLRGPHVSDC